MDSTGTELATPRDARTAAIQVLILVACAALLMRNEVSGMMSDAFRDPEAAHLIAAPILIGLLWWLRRRAMAAALTGGSVFGTVLMLAGVAAFVLSTWPYNYLQPRRMSFAVIVAGIILTVGGWRVLKLSVPMLLLIILAIPIGVRFFARVIVRPESLTLTAVETALSILPDVLVDLEGLDLSYIAGDRSGTIALGDSNRGASLYFGLLSLGIFVTFARIRPLWQVVGSAIMAIPIILFCNFVRLFGWGLSTIVTDAHPLDPTPRLAGYAAGLLAAYLSFGAVLGTMNLLASSPSEDASKEESS